MPPEESTDSGIKIKRAIDNSNPNDNNAQNEVNASRQNSNGQNGTDTASATKVLEKSGILPALSLDIVDHGSGSGKGVDGPKDGSSQAKPDGSIISTSGSEPVSDITRKSTNAVKRADGTIVTTDSGGLLSAMTYPDGATRKFDRDDKGNLTKIENSDGSSWSNEQGQWKHTDASGTEVENTTYAPRVIADGSYTVATADGTVYSVKPDGTGEAKRGDGSTVEYDAHGNVQNVAYPDGQKRSFTYDGHNQLTTFTDTNAQTWTATDGKWQLPDGQPLNQEVTVDGTGELTIGAAGGPKNKYLTNGSSLNTDAKDQVSHVNYQGGSQRDFQRDGDGNITGITETDGHKWSKESDGKWHEYGTDGKATGNSNNSTAEVDAEGNYKIKSADGSWELRKSDGSTVQARQDGMVTDINYADGSKRTFMYNDKNELVGVDEGGYISGKSDDGSWKRINKENPLEIVDTPQVVQVGSDGTIRSWDGADIYTSTKNVVTHPNPGHNLWGEHSGDPLAAITPGAVHQGQLGDCYFLASVASMADANPEAVKDMIHDNGNGTYTVTFPGDPSHPVTVDTPTEQELNSYAHDDGKNGMWVNVMEKAHRQYSGRETEDDGDKANAGVELLSAPGRQIVADDLSGFNGIGRTTYDHVEQDMERALVNNQVITASTQDSGFLNHLGNVNNPGELVGDHVFAVTAYDPQTHMVTMRNPWGVDGKDGTDKKEGTFTISLDDFYNKFTDMVFANS